MRSGGDAAILQCLHEVGVWGRGEDGGVRGECRQVVDGPLVGAADERPFDTSVLVAEGDLQMEDLLAMALEAEVARLDDARVHGSHGYLVHLVALDAVKVHDPDDGHLTVGTAPRVAAWPRRPHEAHGLKPRVAARNNAPLLGDLSLEEVHLGALRR